MKTITILKLEYQQLLEKTKFVDQLGVQVKELLIKNKELEDQNNELLSQIKVFKEKILDLHRRLFDKKKDRVKKNNQRKTGRKPSNAHKGKRGRKSIDPSDIDITKHYDFATPPLCPECNDTMDSMGSNDSFHEDYQVNIKKVKISKAKYICRFCDIIKVADGCRLPIRKGLPMPGFLAQVILDKFSNGLPFYRQAQNYSYANHHYTRQMFNNWMIQSADLILPIVNLILFNMLKSKYLASDETGIVLLCLQGKKSSNKAYMCVLKQNGEVFNFVYCWVIRSRKQDVINDKLKNFKGYLQSDGLNFYFKLKNIKGIISINCWAHARRKFVEVIKLSNNKATGVAFNIVEQIDKLYKIEREIKKQKLSLKDVLELRKTQSKAILDNLGEYLKINKKTTPPKSKLGKAINYVLNRWKELTEYINDPILDIDNNHTERCIKHIVMGRKAWLFANNLDSANKLGALYSLVISCKINNVNPRTYLEYVFTQMPYINKNNIEELEQMLPDRFKLTKRFDKEYLKNKGVVETTIYHNNDQIITKNDYVIKVA